MDLVKDLKPRSGMTQTYPFTLPPLPYAHDALEPHMDALTLEIHHSKHHAKYVSTLNTLIEGEAELRKWTLGDILTSSTDIPAKIRSKVLFNAGGHANHMLFWTTLTPDSDGQPDGQLLQAIEGTFDTIADFQAQFNAQAEAVQGSGWVFLASDSAHDDRLKIVTTPNHETVLPKELSALLICDMWEHAYYLKHQNRRTDYLKSFWPLVDWAMVSKRYLSRAKTPIFA